ncbi:MAG: hypothetical protein ACT4PT_08930 [Methanobacteriota archaeon]
MAHGGELLENDPENRCVGCGPANPTGLRLAFRRDGDRVRSIFVAEPRFQGWPDRLHSGVLYIAMIECANWTVYGLLGRPGFPAKTSALDLRGRVAVGETVEITGRVEGGRQKEDGDGPQTVHVEARVREATVATLSRDFVFPTRDEFAQRMGYATVPHVVDDFFCKGCEGPPAPGGGAFGAAVSAYGAGCGGSAAAVSACGAGVDESLLAKRTTAACAASHRRRAQPGHRRRAKLDHRQRFK